MVNKPECSKTFQSFFTKALYTTRGQVRTAKAYSNLCLEYSTIFEEIGENARQLNLACQTLENTSRRIEILERRNQEKERELEQLKKDIQELEIKIAILENNKSEDSEKKKCFEFQLLREIILNMCMKTYIDDYKLPAFVRGFTSNDQDIKVTPFEIDAGHLSEKAIQDAIWEKCYQSSNFGNEWQELFDEE